MPRKICWLVLALLALIFGLYPILYYTHDGSFRLLGLKSPELLRSLVWKAAFYIHITGGGLALFIGWLQFNNYFRTKYLKVHRVVGKIYVIAALLAGLAGIYLSFYATGGAIAVTGFFLLGLVWVSTTYAAYQSIRQGKTLSHQRLMIYSYACCFAAATLRLWLISLGFFFDFITAYRMVAWLSWVPNLMVAFILVRQLNQRYKPTLS